MAETLVLDLFEVWLLTREGSASLDRFDRECRGKLPVDCATAPGLTSRVLVIALSNLVSKLSKPASVCRWPRLCSSLKSRRSSIIAVLVRSHSDLSTSAIAQSFLSLSSIEATLFSNIALFSSIA